MKKSSNRLTFFHAYSHNIRMKSFIARLSELQKMLLLCLLISLVLIGGACVGLFFDQPGWVIGVSVGCLVEFINIILLYKGSGQILKNEKPALFLVFYGLRMLLVIGAVLGLILLEYKANLVVFKYSFWGVLIGYTPIQIIVIFVSMKHKSNPLEK